MVQIIRICKNSSIKISFILIFVIFSYNNLSASQYGKYLSWSYARQAGDVNNLKNLFPSIDINQISENMLEEALFQSVIFEDWGKATEISSKILSNDKNNVSAIFFTLTNSIINKQPINNYLKESHSQYLDINFLKAIFLWTNIEQSNVDKLNIEDCVPLICLHKGMLLLVEGKKKEALTFLTKVEEQNFSSIRIKELLFYSFLKLNEKNKAEKFFKEMSLKDSNLKPYRMSFFLNNDYLLNPIKTQKDGLAETLYNISSWYYQKNLLKYSIFFGKLSLRIRPNFNAMKLLVANALEEIGYEQLAIELISNVNKRNLYFMKFIKLKNSLQENSLFEKQLLDDLKNLSKTFPKNWQITLLLADKLRSQKKFKESIELYSKVIENESVENKFAILYSRGIAYERSNQWKKAEKDLSDALEINPNDPYVLNYLAYSWLDRNLNLDKAVKLLEKAVELEPNDGYIIDSLGWAFYLTGLIDKSIFYLEKAVSMMPNDATLNDHLGDAYWKSGRRKEASSQWKRVLIIEPNFKNKEKILEKLELGIK
ncbi:tetratricopeptide repeat protein [Alphaproteobacteria bacterium]|nr:tetratricopeptide repeat protein [Alphaproteobacteria bacterium]